MIGFALFFLSVIAIIIFSVIKIITAGYNLGYISSFVLAMLMPLIGLVNFLKNKKIKDQSNNLLVNLFIAIFGGIFLFITVIYAKAGNIIGSILALFFAIIIFSILHERITLSKVKEGMTSNIAKVLGKKYEFTMQLPPGWQTHPHSDNEFFEWKNKESNWGRVEIFPLEIEDEDFYKFVEREVRSYLDEVYGNEAKKTGYSQIISKEVKQTNGRETVQIALDMAESVEFHVYIRSDNEYLWVLFKLLKEHFSQYQPILNDSIASIRINPK